MQVYTKYKHFRDAFIGVDRDRSGVIEREELRKFLVRLGVCTTAEAHSRTVEAFFNLCDHDGNGLISYNEFASHAKAMDQQDLSSLQRPVTAESTATPITTQRTMSLHHGMTDVTARTVTARPSSAAGN